MNYTSVYYYLLTGGCVCFYYALKKSHRWFVLLAFSLLFYYFICMDLTQYAVLLISGILSWLLGKMLAGSDRKSLFAFSILITLAPLLSMKVTGFSQLYLHRSFSFVYPVGISFYTMQMIAYLTDIYKKKIAPQKDLLKYMLFLMWFPQIIQGPIPRYEQLADQLYEGHDYDTDTFMKGIQLIIWGFFLKLMIADKAGAYVDTVYNSYRAFRGIPLMTAALLYSLQIYADFLACTTLAQGVSQLFGIQLAGNFDHPYSSSSIKEFWRRWHMSFSFWLRDHVYFPLGGSRRGKTRKYINLLIVFLISGLWHGTGLTFIVWGIYHAFLQILEETTQPLRDGLMKKTGLSETGRHILSVCVTFLLVTVGWIFFRAPTLRASARILLSLCAWNPWTLFDGTLVRLGLDGKDWIVLLLSVGVLITAEHVQKKIVIRDWFQKQNTAVRWSIYLIAVWSIFLLGSYGYGFSAGDFIYGGF